MLELTRSKPIQPIGERPGQQSVWTRWRKRLRKNATRLLMAAPAVIWIFLFSYIPMFGLVIAFQDYRFDKGIFGSTWVGLQNFRFLVSTEDGFRMTFNTLFMNGLFIITNTVASITVAILLYRIQRRFVTRFYQATMFFPYFISWVIVQAFVFALLNSDTGLINQQLTRMGAEPVQWYSSPEHWRWILTVANLWKSVGFWSIVYFAGMMAISPELYEAAQVDGANGWQQTLYITLPLLVPLVIINVLLSIGRIFYADFGLFYIVTRDQGLLYKTTDVIDTYVFRGLQRTGKIGMASAAGFYQAVVGFVLVFLSNWIVRRIDPDRSLF